MIVAECEQELRQPGGLFFSPPDVTGKVLKLHVCLPCWKQFDNIRQRHVQGVIGRLL